MKEGSSRRKEQGEATKKKLYDSARKLFGTYGVEDVSVDAIVEAAGVSKGTFYVHFVSKNALLSSLISDDVSGVDLDYEAYLNTLPADIPTRDTLLALVGKVFDVIENKIGYNTIRILYKVQLTEPAYAQKVTSYNRALYQMFCEVLDKGIRRGEFSSSLPTDELTRHLILAMRGLTYEWCLRYPDFNLKEQAMVHFRILLNGILAK